MKLSSLLFSIGALVTVAATAAPVAAADAPVQAEKCVVYAPTTTKWPMRRVQMTLTNVSTVAADDITVAVANVGSFTDRVVLAPGAAIRYDAPIDAKSSAFSPANVACSVVAVTFRDGRPAWYVTR